MTNLPKLRTFTLAMVLLLATLLILTSFSTIKPEVAQQCETTTDKIIEPQTERVSLNNDTTIMLTALEIELGVPDIQICAVNITIIVPRKIKMPSQYVPNKYITTNITMLLISTPLADYESKQETYSAYSFDGRGSVVSGAKTDSNLLERTETSPEINLYSPTGMPVSATDSQIDLPTFNGEAYNPVTGLQYLRARYLDVSTGTFMTQDDRFGRVQSITSQNLYTYAENDGVNKVDPSGHSAQQYFDIMRGAGGLNEMRMWTQSSALQSALSSAEASFWAKLKSAQSVSYTDIAAISRITGISQAQANAYINAGIARVHQIAQNYGCTAGSITATATAQFSVDVSIKKEYYNVQIAVTKDMKTAQYNAWRAEQERLAAERAAGGEMGSPARGGGVWDEEKISEHLTVIIANYIANEMNKNVNCLLSMIYQSENYELNYNMAFGYFVSAVWKGNKWDRKPIIEDIIYRTLSMQKYMHSYKMSLFDCFTKIPFKNQYYYYDVWSNIHYGYVGARVGFSRWLLLNGQHLPFMGKGDKGDDLSVRLGFDLADKYPNGVTGGT